MASLEKNHKQTIIDGLNINYIDEGKGQNVLLLHGWAAPAETYRLIIDHLSKRCRVVVPDLPGFGGSSEPEKAWNNDDFVDFIFKFIEEAEMKDMILIGHSHGGRIIIKLMSDPRRKNIAIKKIILMASAGIVPKRSFGYYVKVYSYKIAKKIFPSYAEKIKKKTGSDDYRNASLVMRDTMVKVINEDLAYIIKNIDVPTLLVWGDKDTDTPIENGRFMEKEIVNSGLVELKGGGHFAFAENWEQCSRVLDSFI